MTTADPRPPPSPPTPSPAQRPLLGPAAATFGIQLVATALTLALDFTLARVLGARTYGAYANAIAWLELAALIAPLGFLQVLMREVAVDSHRAAWGRLRGLLRFSDLAGVTGALVMALAGLGLAALIFRDAPFMAAPVALALLFTPLLGLVKLRQSALRGLERVAWGLIPEKGLRPLLNLAAVGIVVGWAGATLGAREAVLLDGLALAIAFTASQLGLRHHLPQVTGRTPPIYDAPAWVRSAAPLILLSGMQALIARTDVLMLGALAPPESPGIYTVTLRLAELVTFPLIAVNLPLASRFALLYADRDYPALEALATRAIRGAFAIALPLGLLLMGVGPWVLAAFGPAFAAGFPALVILIVGQLVNVGAGSVGLLLNMTGHERDATLGIGLGAGLNVVLNAALIPPFGLSGAAIATGASIAVWNLFLYRRVRKRLGIDPAVFRRRLGSL